MAEIKKHPSLPSNYVTLAQLQERWLKEQQQKQNEIEEERKRENEEQEIKKQSKFRERSEIINKSVSIDRRPFQRNRRNPSEKNRRFREVGKSVEVEIEEGQQRKEREKEEQERKLEDEENRNRNEIRERSEIIKNSVSIDRRQSGRNRRNRSENNRRFGEVGVSKSAIAEIEAVVVARDAINDQGEKIAELKNQKKKHKGKRGKPKAQENLIEGTAQLPPEKIIPVAVTERDGEKVALNGEGSENQPEGKEFPVIVTGRNGGREGNSRGIRRNERNSTVNRKIWEKKTPVDQSVETELKFEGLTLNGGTIGNEEPVMKNNGGHSKYNSGNRRYNHSKEYRSVQTELKFESLTLNGGTIGNEEPVMENNGGHSKYNSGYRGYKRPKEWKPRDCNLVWVKRGEISDADATGIQSSGSLAKLKARN